MDIQFIQEEHRDNIFKLMELCNVDMTEAYELYTSSGNNLQNAVQKKFNENLNFQQNNQSNVPQRSYQEAFVPGKNNHFNDFGYGQHQKFGDEEQTYINYKFFKQSSMNFSKRYNVRRSESLIKSFFPKFFKLSSEQHFKKKLEQCTKRKSLLKVGAGTFSEGLQSVSKSRFPLVVHAYDFEPSLNQKLKQIYSDEQFIQTLNTQYQNYGIDCKQYELQDFLKDMVNLKDDRNSIIIMRINIIDAIEVVAKIKIQSVSIADLKKRMKQIKSNCIQLEMEELHMEKRYGQELKGNFEYQKPLSIAERKKLNQDRQIRRKQEEEFFQAMQQKPVERKQQTHSKQEENTNKQANNYSSSKVQTSAVNSAKPQKQDVLKKRKQVRQNLKAYAEGPGMILIKLRMPSGQSLKLYAAGKQTPKYLFDYVQSLQSEELGFQNDLSRSFDIIRPYDKLNLSDKMKDSLNVIFQESDMQSLVVNQRL